MSWKECLNQKCSYSVSMTVRGMLAVSLCVMAAAAAANGGLVKVNDAPTVVHNSKIPERQEKFGVPVYPDARLDANATAFLESSGMRGTAYRSAATLASVTAFYDISKLKRRGKLGSEYVLFGTRCREEYVTAMKETVSLGCTVDVTLQSPWMDPLTGEMRQGTLISIVNNGDE